MITKINELDQANIKKLNSYEEELKNIENEIKLKKNIISEQELEKEVNDLKKKISDFNKEKNLMVKNFNDIKKKELKIFFDMINPIVQNYMNEKHLKEISYANKGSYFEWKDRENIFEEISKKGKRVIKANLIIFKDNIALLSLVLLLLISEWILRKKKGLL